MTLITRKTDYATRVLLHLALLSPGGQATTQDIAHRQLIPERLIRHIISQLAKARLLSTKRGKGGGVQLARPAAEISLLDVVEAMQGPLSLNLCVDEPDSCALAAECPMHEAWARTQEELANWLRQETLDKLTQRSETLAALQRAAD
ncbi:MAG: Rrf2 family transcriptional regulator [Anaerolineae bacterium]|nr:Rrf2 family transcriptional regulator [Anaerolineae bacterium]